MAKRKLDLDEDSPHRKRQKITNNALPREKPVKVESVQDLQALLAFDHDAGPQTRQSESLRVYINN